jgi:hypothetical protein
MRADNLLRHLCSVDALTTKNAPTKIAIFQDKFLIKITYKINIEAWSQSMINCHIGPSLWCLSFQLLATNGCTKPTNFSCRWMYCRTLHLLIFCIQDTATLTSIIYSKAQNKSLYIKLILEKRR